jgi:hypothetical protein
MAPAPNVPPDSGVVNDVRLFNEELYRRKDPFPLASLVTP